MTKKIQGYQKGDRVNHSVNINKNIYKRGLIVVYVVADEDSQMKDNLRNSYTELMEK